MRSLSFLALGPRGFHRVAYKDWGDPRARHVVVCVHGLTRNARDFDFLARSLASDCRVVCPDVVGRGDSDWLEDKSDYNFGLYQNDAAALISRITAPDPPGGPLAWLRRSGPDGGHRQLDWIGTSMGGLIGMMLAARRNSPIRRLVLNDVGPIIPWAALIRLKGYAGRPRRFETLEEVETHIRQVCASFGPLGDAQWRHLAEHSVRRDDGGRYTLAYDPGISNPSAMRGEFSLPFGRGAVIGMDLWQLWDRIRCPTLVLRGAESDMLRADTAAEMARRGPRAKVIECSGIGHAPALMSREQTDPISEFLLGDG